MRFLVRLLLVSTGLLLLTAGLAGATDDLQALFEAANRKLDAGDAAGAIEDYNRILEQEPKADNVWLNRALARWQLKDASGARADVAQAISLNPEHPEAYRMRASLRYEQRDYAAALADMERAIELAPDNAELYAMRGEIRVAMEGWDEAIEDLDRAIEMDDTLTFAFYQRGKAREGKGDFAQAIADYSRVIERVPDNADALNQRAWLHFHARTWASAIADGRKVLELAPKAAVAARVVGYAQFGAGDFGAAADTLVQLIELSADNAEGVAFPLYIRHLGLTRTARPDARLKDAIPQWKDEPWLMAIGQFLTGQISEEELEQVAEQAEGDERSGRECEANFYIGMVRAIAKDRSTARMRFKAALATKQTTFIEYTLAETELERLK